MDRAPSEKFALLFEAAKRCLLAAEMSLQQLAENVVALSGDIDQKVEINTQAIPPYLAAVAFIDFAHRYRSIVNALPLIKKKTPEMRRLNQALASVETARHQLQHIDRELSSNEAIDYPILGSLAWINNGTCYTACLSQPFTAKFFSISYDKSDQTWTAQHQYTVKDATINLDHVLSEMRVAYNWIVQKVSSSEPSLLELKWGATVAFKFGLLHEGSSPVA